MPGPVVVPPVWVCAGATLMTRMIASGIKTFFMRSLLGVGEAFTPNFCFI
jgi:hypothetical protein